MELDRIKRNVAKMASANAPVSDIDGYLASEGVSVEQIKNHKIGTPQQPDVSVDNQPKGFIERVNEDLRQTGANAADIASYAGVERMIEHPINQAAGLVNIGAQGVKSAGNYMAEYLINPLNKAINPQAPNIGEALSNVASGTTDKINTVNKAINPNAPTLGEAAQNVSEGYGEFADQNPRKAVALKSLMQATSLIPAQKATTVAGSGLEKVASSNMGKALLEKAATPKDIMPNSEQFAAIKKTRYDEALKSGETFSPEGVANKLADEAATSKMDKVAGVMELEDAPRINSLMEKYETLRSRPMTIKEVDALDKELTQLKHSAVLGDKPSWELSSRLGDLQNSLRKSVLDAPSGSALAKGREAFIQERKMSDIEQIFRNAEGRPNEAAIIQTGYRNLARQARKKGSGWSKEQIDMMDKAAKGGLSIDALKFGSSKLLAAIVGSTGGFGSGAAVYLGNIAAGAGATALQTAKGRKLAESITKGLNVKGEPTTTNKIAQKLLDDVKNKEARIVSKVEERLTNNKGK
jgi:hypothetical protein